MMIYAVGSLKYTVNQKLNRENYKCNSSATMESFTSCVFSKFKQTECTAIITKIGNYGIICVCGGDQILRLAAGGAAKRGPAGEGAAQRGIMSA